MPELFSCRYFEPGLPLNSEYIVQRALSELLSIQWSQIIGEENFDCSQAVEAIEAPLSWILLTTTIRISHGVQLLCITRDVKMYLLVGFNHSIKTHSYI